VAVLGGPDGTPSSDNTVERNDLVANAPDLAWDQTGTGNRFGHNRCLTSDPAGLYD
jgi:hypothetical protein